MEHTFGVLEPETKKTLIVVDMQNDFVYGVLGTAEFPEDNISVDASCCACVTPESHKAALATMKMCQINVIEEVLS